MRIISYIIISTIVLSCASKAQENSQTQKKTMNTNQDTTNSKLAYFGAGCFWCVEAQFELLDGVIDARSGYSGGATENPSYKEVCSGNTGHAEVIEVRYDPEKINYETLLQAFFQSHDPTTLNRQGNDVGTQYRSVIFYTDETQKKEAEETIKALDEAEVYSSPIVTEVTAFEKFYPAEDYHQQYYELNGEQPYCRMVIQPKYEKFKKVFEDQLKK